MIDIHTLLFASVTARSGFILIFLIASFRSEARIAFRFWSASILGSAIGVMLIYADPNYPYFLVVRGMMIYGIIGLSLSCIWAGVRVFFGDRVNKAVFAVMGLTPGIVYGGARILGILPDVVVLLTIVTLVFSIGFVAHAFLTRKRSRYLPSQLLVGIALSGYSLALCASLVMVAVRLLTPGAVPDLQATDISLALFIDQLTSVLIYVGLVSMSLEDVQARMKELATTDPLTGLANRRGVQEQTSALIAACYRAKRPLSVLIADLDHFKSINDRYGHDCGDKVLREFAARLSSLGRRGQDVTGRWGGEEFLVVLSDMTLAQAVSFAEHLRRRISGELFDIGTEKIAVTVSIGVAGFGSGVTPLATAVTAADEALYEAKRSGRNRVHSVAMGTAPAHDALVPGGQEQSVIPALEH